MGIPAYVSEADTTVGAGTSVATTLPGSLVNGNVILSFIVVQASNNSISVSGGGGGWTLGGTQFNAGGGNSGAWAWTVYASGTTTAPTFSWTSSVISSYATVQYSGNATPTAVGASSGNMNTTANFQCTVNSITTTADNSRIVHWVGGGNPSNDQNSIQQHVLSNYTQRFNRLNFGGLNYALFDQQCFVSGSATDVGLYDYVPPIPPSQLWTSFAVEVLGTGAHTAGEPHLISSQTTEAVLESYTNVTNLRSSQVSMQVLRTQGNFIPIPHSFACLIG